MIAEAPATKIKEQTNIDDPDDSQNKDTKAQAEMLAKAIVESTGPSAAPPPTSTTPEATRSRSPTSSSSYDSDVESDSDKADNLSEKARMRAGPARQAACVPQRFVPPLMFMPPNPTQFIPIMTPPLTPPPGVWVHPQADVPMPDAQPSTKKSSIRYASAIQDKHFDLQRLLKAIGSDVTKYDDEKVVFHTARSRKEVKMMVHKTLYKKYRVYLGNRAIRIVLPARAPDASTPKCSTGHQPSSATMRIADKVGATINRAILTPATHVKRKIYSSSGAPRPTTSPPPFNLWRTKGTQAPMTPPLAPRPRPWVRIAPPGLRPPLRRASMRPCPPLLQCRPMFPSQSFPSEAHREPPAPRPTAAPLTVPSRDVARLLRSVATLIDPKPTRAPPAIIQLRPSVSQSESHPTSCIVSDGI